MQAYLIKLIMCIVGLIVLVRITVFLVKPGKKAGKHSVEVPASYLGQTDLVLYPVQIGDKWGYMNRQAKLVIPATFIQADDFYEGRAAVDYSLDDTSGDLSGQTLHRGYIDHAGVLITSVNYEQAYGYSDGMALVKRNGLYGYLDLTGKEVLPPQYEEASSFSEGLAAVRLKGKAGLIDKTGRMVKELPIARTRVLSTVSFNQGFSPVYVSVSDGHSSLAEDLGGYIDTQGNWLIEPEFVNAFPFSEGLAPVLEQTYKYAFIDTAGRIVIRTEFEDTWGFYEDIAIGWKLSPDKRQKIWYGINRDGEVVLSNLNYRTVGIFQNGLAAVQDFNLQWGFIDKSGKVVVKPQFAGISRFRNGLARVEVGSFFNGLQTVYIDPSGKFVWKP